MMEASTAVRLATVKATRDYPRLTPGGYAPAVVQPVFEPHMRRQEVQPVQYRDDEGDLERLLDHLLRDRHKKRTRGARVHGKSWRE